MTKSDHDQLARLYKRVKGLAMEWELLQSFDLRAAENLVQVCKRLPPSLLPNLPGVSAILTYVDENSVWSSEDAFSWPNIIKSDLKFTHLAHTYRANNDAWEVSSISLTGAVNLVGSVNTELTAQILVDGLTHSGLRFNKVHGEITDARLAAAKDFFNNSDMGNLSASKLSDWSCIGDDWKQVCFENNDDRDPIKRAVSFCRNTAIIYASYEC
jgi:hypothetical protein